MLRLKHRSPAYAGWNFSCTNKNDTGRFVPLADHKLNNRMNWLRQNWFMAALISCLGVGFWLTDPLHALTDSGWVKWTIVSLTMVAMTWPLKTSSLVSAAANPIPAILASTINLVAAPLLAWPLSQFLSDDMAAGFLLAAAAPSTLASAAVWTRRAGGNDSVAMMVTIITNAICFLVTPAWVFWLIGQQITGFDVSDTIFKLLLFVVLPMAVGQALRVPSGLAQWATNNKPKFSLFAQIGILAMVFILPMLALPWQTFWFIKGFTGDTAHKSGLITLGTTATLVFMGLAFGFIAAITALTPPTAAPQAELEAAEAQEHVIEVPPTTETETLQTLPQESDSN